MYFNNRIPLELAIFDFDKFPNWTFLKRLTPTRYFTIFIFVLIWVVRLSLILIIIFQIHLLKYNYIVKINTYVTILKVILKVEYSSFTSLN